MDTSVNANDNVKTAAEAGRFKTRRNALMRGLKRDVDVDCMLVTNPADIRYLCGATEGIHSLLVMDGEATLHTGEMFRVQAIQESPGTTVQTTAGDLFKQTVDWATDREAKTVGFQDDHMTVSRHRSLRKAAAKRVRLLRVGDLTASARAVKDAEEIASTRRAVAIAEKAFRALMDRGAAWFIGRTERQIAAELDCLMALDGADAPSFPTIVASGPNSYHCHHVPGTRVVRHGDALLVDWGAELNGYRSDITRVLFMGSAPDRLATLYSIALSAHDEAVAAMRPRVRCHTVNELARGIIRNAGYDKEFRHGLGHGIGLQVHEHPYFSGRPAKGAGVTLKAGMIVTVEPGIYLEGIGGVRIEDDILVTPQGHERLNQLPRSLEAMVLA